jgi:hypothetical protein
LRDGSVFRARVMMSGTDWPRCLTHPDARPCYAAYPELLQRDARCGNNLLPTPAASELAVSFVHARQRRTEEQRRVCARTARARTSHLQCGD